MKQDYENQPGEVCGAKTRNGQPCMNSPVAGKKRCRIHGGAEGSGAPKGNKNALKHGYYTAAAIAERKAARQAIRETRELLDDILGSF